MVRKTAQSLHAHFVKAKTHRRNKAARRRRKDAIRRDRKLVRAAEDVRIPAHTSKQVRIRGYFDKEKELRAEFRAKLVAWFEKTDPRIILAYNKQRKAANKQKVYAPADTSRPSKPLPSFIQYVRLFSPPSRAPSSFPARVSDDRLTVMQSFSGLLAISGTRSSTAPTFPTRRRFPSTRGLSPRSGRRSLRRSRRYVSRPLMVLGCVFRG